MALNNFNHIPEDMVFYFIRADSGVFASKSVCGHHRRLLKWLEEKKKK
jgi:hypothetical protein